MTSKVKMLVMIMSINERILNFTPDCGLRGFSIASKIEERMIKNIMKNSNF